MIRKKERNSSIELLKIFAIFIIVIGHTTLCLGSLYPYSTASVDLTKLVLAIFHLLGGFGNTIFFICSAWFLLDSKKLNKRKWFNMVCEIWAVSVVIMLISIYILKYPLSKEMILRSLTPIINENNWYMTCYLVFYLIHPFLNKLIDGMNKTKLFRCTFLLTMLYVVINFFKVNTFYFNMIALWITIYFIMAYIKKYQKNISSNLKVNLLLIYVGLAGYICTIFICDIIGLANVKYNSLVLFSANNCNPFIIMLSIGLFNIARSKEYHNNIINYISGLSLPIYIIHENIILRSYMRVDAWKMMLNHFGYNHLILQDLLLATMTFLVSIIVATIYRYTLERFVIFMSNKLYDIFRKIYVKIENTWVKIS